VRSAERVIRPVELSPSMKFHMANGGSSAAAWLVWECRKMFERTGEVDLVIPEAKETPSWLRVATEYLRVVCPSKWSVVVFRRGSGDSEERVYRISWKDHDWYREWRDQAPGPKESAPSWRTRRLGRDT
jgi:hypothetical protein